MSDLNDIVQLAPRVKSLFPDGIIATQAFGIASPRLLLSAEQRHVHTAVPKRQSEFAAGRACARRALVTMGFIEAPLLADKARVPLWPTGVTGSISHTDGYCVAVVGLTGHFSGLGVDTEILGRVEPALWEHVFRPDEIGRLKSLNYAKQTTTATVMFSAKEAFYKCQYAQTRAWLEFEDVSIEVNDNSFQVLVHNSTYKDVFRHNSLEGRFSTDDARVVCGIAIQQ